MQYGIGRVVCIADRCPNSKRVELLNVTTEAEGCVGVMFCVSPGSAYCKEGEIVFVSFIPDDQFCKVHRLDDVKLILDTPSLREVP